MNENLPKQFLFVLYESAVSQYMFDDLDSDKRVTVIKGFLKTIHNPIINYLRKVHLSLIINRRINLPFKNIWHCSLRDVKWNHKTQYYVILVNSALRLADYKYLSRIRNKYNIKYILLMVDPWDSNKYSIPARYFADKLGFDYIFSFDPVDCKKYNFIYTNVPYIKLCNDVPNTIDYDIYLIANVSTRGGADVFHNIFKRLKDAGLSISYRLVNVLPKDQIYKNEIIYNKTMEYPEVIKDVERSNCILEVLANGQTGATYRYYEAVCYNKKLLTTNKNVVNLPFYNPEYMKVFEKPEDIDCEWIKERIPIDYGYDGRFSSTHLIDKIIELEDQKEG